jgi:hypothetical protein
MNLCAAGRSFIAGLCCLATGCWAEKVAPESEPSPTADAGERGASQNEFQIFPRHIYTGFDGVHRFVAPVVSVDEPGALTWSIADRKLARLTPSAEKNRHVMIEPERAGETKLSAEAARKRATATLSIASYTEEQYEAGKRRYAECMECHARGKAPIHTPTELDGYSDQQIEDTFVLGVDPEGRRISDNAEFAAVLGASTHAWAVSDAEKVGLVVYLRALPEMGFPELDVPLRGTIE